MRKSFLALALSGVFFVSAFSASADTLGEQRTFNVDAPFDARGRSLLTATLKNVSDRAYGYGEDQHFAALSASSQQSFTDAAASLLSTFDNTIYPRLTVLFGPPWEPGIDNDMRLTVLFEELAGSFGGYINTADEFPKSRVSRSNEREMVYLNAKLFTAPRLWWSVLAHEFTHLATFFAKNKTHNVEEELWLNEARAEYGSFVSGSEAPLFGSNLSSRLAAFRANAHDSLTEFLGGAADYGTVAIFAQYLGSRFGDDVFGRSLASSKAGIASLDEALATEEGSPSFAQAFRDFIAAVWADDTRLDPVYTFANSGLAGATIKPSQPTRDISLTPGSAANVSQTTKDWSGQWVRFAGSGDKTLEVTLEGSMPLVASLVLTKSDGTKAVVVGTPSAPQTSVILRADEFGTSVTEAVVAFAVAGKTANFTQSEPLRSWNITAQLVEPAPFSITSAVPSQVAAFGGTQVTLQGKGFTNDLSLAIDEVSVPLEFIDVSTLRFVAPQLPPGQKCVTLQNAAGESTKNCTALTAISFVDGSLVRAQNDIRVYIVKGNILRHIVAPDIFNFYGHLSFAQVQQVSPEVVMQFGFSALVRADGDPRVYEVNDDGIRHWVNMTPEQFVQTGRSWEGVYIINTQERDWYRTGDDVLFR